MLVKTIFFHSLLLVLVAGRGGEKRRASETRSPSPPTRRQRTDAPLARSPSTGGGGEKRKVPEGRSSSPPSAQRQRVKLSQAESTSPHPNQPETSPKTSPAVNPHRGSTSPDYRNGGFTTSGSLSSWQTDRQDVWVDPVWTKGAVKGPHSARLRTSLDGRRSHKASLSDAIYPKLVDLRKSQMAITSLSSRGRVTVEGSGWASTHVVVDATKSKQGGWTGAVQLNGEIHDLRRVEPGSKQKYRLDWGQAHAEGAMGTVGGRGRVRVDAFNTEPSHVFAQRQESEGISVKSDFTPSRSPTPSSRAGGVSGVPGSL